jgi:predicted nucleic acid-binding protein
VVLVDTNVIFDVLEDDSQWFEWSSRQMRNQSRVHELLINPVIYAELSPGFESQQRLDQRLETMDIGFRELSKPALFIAGVAHRYYRNAGGPRQSVLADFFIGAHAAVLGCAILTRDARRYRAYFPRVPLISPATAR